MSQEIFFTIVVATDNDENFVLPTLNSIKKQTESSYEVIVIDGGSKDRTLESVYKVPFTHRSLYTLFEPATYYMWNKGLKMARGRYILFFKAGTYFTSKYMLERLRSDIESLRDPDLVLTCGMGYHRKNRRLHTPPMSVRRLVRGILPTTLSSRIFRTQMLRATGGFDTSFEVRASFDLMCRYVANPAVRLASLSYVITDGMVNFSQKERFLEYHSETPRIMRQNFGWVKLMTYLVSHSTWIAFRYWLGNLHFHSADELG